ncbi:hypothetical protein P0M11_11290 [Kaistella sp. PBT33-4]|uniref:hypothetical protein n=1 Tax=Kaistella sp. PBT33-4 TaxID=3032000 RepID=UPI0023D85563|nr:hypothetical protein [Kaistella sp. PBT33-4]MDF0720581.1 hypothetical protein [Kaistella sp. PBT33-4]
MKNFIIFTITLLATNLGAQGTLYIENYSNYPFAARIVAGNQQNCTPEAVGSFNFPGNYQVSIPNFNGSLPTVSSWSVRLSPTGNVMMQSPPNSGILNTISGLTRWEFCSLQSLDPNTGQPTNDIDFFMGDPNFSNCWQGNDFVDGNLTDAFWFYLPTTNTTYLVIQ